MHKMKRKNGKAVVNTVVFGLLDLPVEVLHLIVSPLDVTSKVRFMFCVCQYLRTSFISNPLRERIFQSTLCSFTWKDLCRFNTLLKTSEQSQNILRTKNLLTNDPHFSIFNQEDLKFCMTSFVDIYLQVENIVVIGSSKEAFGLFFLKENILIDLSCTLEEYEYDYCRVNNYGLLFWDSTSSLTRVHFIPRSRLTDLSPYIEIDNQIVLKMAVIYKKMFKAKNFQHQRFFPQRLLEPTTGERKYDMFDLKTVQVFTSGEIRDYMHCLTKPKKAVFLTNPQNENELILEHVAVFRFVNHKVGFVHQTNLKETSLSFVNPINLYQYFIKHKKSCSTGEKKHGWFSAKQEEKYGSSVWTTYVDFTIVTVTKITREKKTLSGNPNVVYRGLLHEFICKNVATELNKP
jgi:hypothetical protein